MPSKQSQHHIVSVFLAVLLIVALSGCSMLVETRPVLIEESDPIRIGPNVSGRVYFVGEDGTTTLTDREAMIPEGWYAVSPDLYELLIESAGGQDAP